MYLQNIWEQLWSLRNTGTRWPLEQRSITCSEVLKLNVFRILQKSRNPNGSRRTSPTSDQLTISCWLECASARTPQKCWIDCPKTFPSFWSFLAISLAEFIFQSKPLWSRWLKSVGIKKRIKKFSRCSNFLDKILHKFFQKFSLLLDYESLADDEFSSL